MNAKVQKLCERFEAALISVGEQYLTGNIDTDSYRRFCEGLFAIRERELKKLETETHGKEKKWNL